MQDEGEGAARAMVAKWEHGDEKHRQWLRDVATPDVYALTTRVERLEAALKFYADEANWRATIEHTPEFMLNGRPRRDAYRKEAPVVMDQGKDARAALGDAKEGK